MESYPLDLRTIIQAGKSRSQPAAFSVSSPRRGYAYAKETGTDTPVFWDVSFAFTQAEAIRFQLWFRYSISRGVDEFVMPIRTEFGMVDHVCRFLPDGLLDNGEQGGVWTYKAQIMARAQVIPDGWADAASIIVATPDWEEYASWLDVAMADAWPVEA